MDASFALALFVVRETDEIDEMVVVVFVTFDPRARDGRELDRAIGLIDVDEPGPFEQLSVRKMGGDRDGAITVGAAPPAGAQSGRGMDGEEGGAPAAIEQESGCSQHGELGPESTQHIGVHDGIETAGPEGQRASARCHRRHSVDHMLGVGASKRPSQTVERDVAEDRFTARARGEVQTRPATSRPEIEEPHARPETQQVGEQVSLSHRRVAVDPPVGTDDGPFDLAHHIGPILGVAIAELLARVVFLTGNRTAGRSCRSSGPECEAEHLVGAGVGLAAGAGECVDRVADPDIDESGVVENCLPARTGQPAGNSTSPQVDVAQRPRGDRAAVGDVGEL